MRRPYPSSPDGMYNVVEHIYNVVKNSFTTS